MPAVSAFSAVRRGLQKPGDVAALAQLGDLQLDAAGARIPVALPCSHCGCSAVRGSQRSGTSARWASTSSSIRRWAMKLHRLAQHVDIGSLLGELGKRHSGVGHRGSLLDKVLVGRTSTLSGILIGTAAAARQAATWGINRPLSPGIGGLPPCFGGRINSNSLRIRNKIEPLCREYFTLIEPVLCCV